MIERIVTERQKEMADIGSFFGPIVEWRTGMCATGDSEDYRRYAYDFMQQGAEQQHTTSALKGIGLLMRVGYVDYHALAIEQVRKRA